MDELLTEAAISFGSCIKFFYRNNQDIILSKEILLEESNHEGIQISDLLLFQHFKKSLVHDYITSLNEKMRFYLNYVWILNVFQRTGIYLNPYSQIFSCNRDMTGC